MLTWQAETASLGIAGRALARVRDHNFVVDDYAMAPYNGPGEEPGAAELFLAGVTTCAVLMLERIARTDGLPLTSVRASMEASRDSDTQAPGAPPAFDSTRLQLAFRGLTREQAGQLVETFKGK
ncbi:MAG: OsmC family protein [Gaiellales bacterium]